MGSIYFIVLAVCLTGMVIRSGYELLKKDGKIDPKNKTVFAIVVAGMSLFLPAWVFLSPLDPWHINLPGIVNWLGLGLVICGVFLMLSALYKLRGVENIDHLVTDGIFARLRHPMYAGFILWILDWTIFHGAGLSFLVGLVGIGNVLFWRALEEEKLVVEYGEGYKEYRKGTWF